MILQFLINGNLSVDINRCINAGLPHDESYTRADIYVRKVYTLKDPDEVIDLLYEMQLDYAGRMEEINTSCLHFVIFHFIMVSSHHTIHFRAASVYKTIHGNCTIKFSCI